MKTKIKTSQVKLNYPHPDMSKIAGGYLVPEGVSPKITSSDLPKLIYKIPVKSTHLISNLLSSDSCNDINNFMLKAPKFAPVSFQGLQEVTEDTIGSYRCTMWNEEMAENLWEIIRKDYPEEEAEKTCDMYTSTDWWQDDISNKWKAVGVSPLLRYMKYYNGGSHAAHYDAGYLYPDSSYRTLKSFVLYLTTNNSGATKLINDEQKYNPIWNRNHADWNVDVKESQVLFNSYPKKGSILLFDHRLCHSVGEFKPENPEEVRIIIRGDIIYQAVK